MEYSYHVALANLVNYRWWDGITSLNFFSAHFHTSDYLDWYD